MPLDIPSVAPTLLVRAAAFEQAGLTRSMLDARFNLTDSEFRAERGLIAIGPLFGETSVADAVRMFEEAGLVYYEDFFDLSGNWPVWLRLLAMAETER